MSSDQARGRDWKLFLHGWRLPITNRSFGGFSIVELTQFTLGGLKPRAPTLRKLAASAIDVKVQHRHGRSKWVGFPATALIGGTF